MYIGRDWDPANVTESQVYSYDFVNDLGTGETLLTTTFTLTVLTGVDANPSSHLSGSPGISGTIVSQRVQYLTAGVVYILTATVTTSASNTLTLYSHIPAMAIK